MNYANQALLIVTFVALCVVIYTAWNAHQEFLDSMLERIADINSIRSVQHLHIKNTASAFDKLQSQVDSLEKQKVELALQNTYLADRINELEGKHNNLLGIVDQLADPASIKTRFDLLSVGEFFLTGRLYNKLFVKQDDSTARRLDDMVEVGFEPDDMVYVREVETVVPQSFIVTKTGLRAS